MVPKPFYSFIALSQKLGERTSRKPQIKSSSQSALFNFHSFLTVVLLLICTCTFLKMQFPTFLEQKTGFRGFFWKAARVGERLSPWVAAGSFAMGVSIIFF
uniref:Protein kish n=1 Tax=Vitis vinifera TaxID=29760 RepID=F6HU50_VITVI